MITVIRRYFKSSSQIVLWVVIAAFIIGLMPMAFRQMSKSSIWAIRVNGQEIGYQEFVIEQDRQRERLMAFRAQYGPQADWFLSLLGAVNPQILAMRALAKQELFNQFADKIGVHISDEFVVKKINDPLFIQQELSTIIPVQIIDPKTGINQEMLSKYLKRFGLSSELFERQIERMLVDKLVTDIVTSTLYVPEFDIQQRFLALHAKKSFSLLSFSLDSFLKEAKKKTVSLEDLTNFYEQQNQERNRYLVPEKRNGIAWTFDPKSYHILVSDTQVEEYYEKNKLKKYVETPTTITVRRILLTIPDAASKGTVEKKAAHLKEELRKNPALFAEVAQRFSEDKQTASQGGLLKPFARGSYEPAFDRAAFLLQNDTDISEVIKTSQGLELIQRVSKSPQTFKPLQSVYKEIKTLLEDQIFQKQFVAEVKKVIEKEEALASFIKDKGGKLKEMHNVALDTTPISQHLFKLHPNQRAFFIDGTQGVIVRLNTIKEQHVPSLDSIKTTVLEDYYQYQAQQALQKALQEAKQAVSKQPLSKLQKTMHAEFVQTKWLAPDDQETIEFFKKKGLPIDRMLQMENVETLLIHQHGAYGFLIRLDEIEPLDTQKFAKERSGIAQKLEAERLQQYLEGFVASLYRNATLETNESVITLQV